MLLIKKLIAVACFLVPATLFAQTEVVSNQNLLPTSEPLLDVAGIIKANFFRGDGSMLTDLPMTCGGGHSLDAVDGDPVDVVFVGEEGELRIALPSLLTLPPPDGPPQPRLNLRLVGAVDFAFQPFSDKAVLMYSHGASGLPVNDGFRIRYTENFRDVQFQDALVFEKTDSNDAVPDGLIAFVNRGMADLEEPIDEAVVSMVIRGTGNVGIGLVDPAVKLDVNGNVKATSFIGDGSSLGNVVHSESDPTVIESIKDGVSWSEIADIPLGFADGVDDVLGNVVEGDLMVNGLVESTTGGIRFPDGSTQTTAAPAAPRAVAFQAYRSANLTVPDNNTLDLAADVVELDTHFYYDISNFRFNPQQEGLYFLYANVLYQPDDDDPARVEAFLFKNDSNVAEANTLLTKSNATVVISRILYLNGTTDYVTFHTRQNNLENINSETVLADSRYSFIGGYLIGSTQ